MATKKEEQPQAQQGDAAATPPPPPTPADGQPHTNRGTNAIIKSGALFISSKGIGWTSWKRRWFILTRTSLVFFRSDPNAAPHRGGEVNLTLGGIDLNNSGSVVVKQDKKLLTVLFPDGRDGRAFTLKAETSEDLNDWKIALENALAQAPSAAHVMGQNGVFKNDQSDTADGTKEQANDKQPQRCAVLGRPILLALEDVDGAPTFLEKALRFVEEHGVKVEGILRQAADVEHVERRIREYEQGKCDFSPDEDAHVIADCVKYVLRELPSSPVPASCCNALLAACRTDRSGRLNAMRTAILDSFPEPNRQLLQRILMMMQTVASHKVENRMSSSAVAACMAPLLLRPLLSGECEIESDFDVGGDGSLQLLQAAAAANHAQAICITLLEQYEYIFGEHYAGPDLDSEDSSFDSEETDDESYEDDEDEEDYETEGSDAYTDDDYENDSAGTGSKSGDSRDKDDKDSDHTGSSSKDIKAEDDLKADEKLEPKPSSTPLPKIDDAKRSKNTPDQVDHTSAKQTNNEPAQPSKDFPVEGSDEKSTNANKPISKFESGSSTSTPGFWRRSSARKNLSMDSIDFPEGEALSEIARLEAAKYDLENNIVEEVKANATLQASLEKRKKSLHEHRLALEKDVARLQEQLQEERKKRAALEARLNASQQPISVPETIDDKTKAGLREITKAEADIIHLKKKDDDLGAQLNQERERNSSFHAPSDQNPKAPSCQESSRKDRQKKKQKDEERSAGKEIYLDEAVSESGKKQEPSVNGKHRIQNQHPDLARKNSSKHNSNPKKSSTMGEVADSATLALTKLTSRLNFSKEKRSPNPSEPQSLRNAEKGRRSDAPGGEDSVQNSEKLRKSESQIIDGAKRSEGSHIPVLDRGKSEGHSSQMSQNADEARGLDQPADSWKPCGR